MSIELVKKYYEFFNKKDINSILTLVSEDVINDANQGDTTSGKDIFKKNIETAWEFFNEKVSNIDLMVNEKGDNITSEYLVDGVYYKTKPGLFEAKDQHYAIKCAAIFKIKNNKIVRVTRYYNVKKWLEMVNPEGNKN